MATTAAPAKPTLRPPIDLGPYAREVERGLQNEKNGLDAAMERQNFFDYDGERWESKFKRDAESSFDYQGRPHRPSGFLRQCVEILCEHMYCPGPSRTWTDKPGRDFLDKVYADNLVDAVMAEAETLGTLNDCAAIQIDAGLGVYDDRPISYKLWGKEQFVAWPDPEDATKPGVVCTIDRYDLRTRFRLWNTAEVRTFLTKKAEDTAGGTAAEQDGPPLPHDYGCLPFVLCHYKLPVRDMVVSSPGKLVHKAEIRIDNRLNFLDEAVTKHINPVPVAEGVPADWKPVVEPMRFIRMPLAAPRPGEKGGYEPGEFARLYFLQPQVDVAGAWADLTGYMNQVFRAARVPISAVLIEEQPGVISGIALLLLEAPLFKRARKRRGIWSVYENDLARRTLLCAGNHYGMPELVNSARKGRLVLGWPQPTIPVPTEDTLKLLQEEVGSGFKSHLMALQQWYGVSRDEALVLIEQIKTDTDELKKVFPDIAAPSPDRTDLAADEDPGPAGSVEADPRTVGAAAGDDKFEV